MKQILFILCLFIGGCVTADPQHEAEQSFARAGADEDLQPFLHWNFANEHLPYLTGTLDQLSTKRHCLDAIMAMNLDSLDRVTHLIRMPIDTFSSAIDSIGIHVNEPVVPKMLLDFLVQHRIALLSDSRSKDVLPEQHFTILGDCVQKEGYYYLGRIVLNEHDRFDSYLLYHSNLFFSRCPLTAPYKYSFFGIFRDLWVINAVEDRITSVVLIRSESSDDSASYEKLRIQKIQENLYRVESIYVAGDEIDVNGQIAKRVHSAILRFDSCGYVCYYHAGSENAFAK